MRGFAVVAIAGAAAVLGGCAHHRHDDRRAYGSIKDDPGSAPVAKAAAPLRRAASGSVEPRIAYAANPPQPAGLPLAQPTPAATAASGAVSSPQPVAAPIETASIDAAKSSPAAADNGQTADQRSLTEARVISRHLLEEGERLVSMGKVVEGRMRLFAAMEGANPRVLLALARSFDAAYLSKLTSPDAAPDTARAVALYQRAIERGSGEAADDLARLKAAPPTSEPTGVPAFVRH